MSVISRMLGVTNGKVYDWINTKANVREVIAEVRESLVDLAECRLFEAVNRAEPWAIDKVLSEIGKHRGWTKDAQKKDNKGEILQALETMVNSDSIETTVEISSTSKL